MAICSYADYRESGEILRLGGFEISSLSPVRKRARPLRSARKRHKVVPVPWKPTPGPSLHPGPPHHQSLHPVEIFVINLVAWGKLSIYYALGVLISVL